MKVYELAKKLEVKSVFLMEKIRKEWKLPVKTHMESLTPELIKKIETNFHKSQKTLKKKIGIEKKTNPIKRKTSSIKRKTTLKKKSPNTQTIDPSENSEIKNQDSPSVTPINKKSFIIRRQSDKKTLDAKSIKKPLERPSSQKPNSSTTEIKNISKNIRLDLVSVKTTNPLDEDFWKQKEEPEPPKKQAKKPIAEKDLSSKFNATDFRKREVIFQPRKKRIAQVGELKNTLITKPKNHKRIIKVHGEMSLETLCKKIGIKKHTFIKKLKSEGAITQAHSILDFETIALVLPYFGFEAKNIKQTETNILNKIENKKTEKQKKILKTPVITIMGHVDHGKTTLLDYIRKSKTVDSEFGGITQHIGAYSVSVKGKSITFIDTPGHSAFTAMRSRGAQATDIVVLLIAATDGVMPQSLEALNHAKSARTPLLIAINKIDAPGANPDKIKKQLSEKGVVPEDWGGDTSFINISALKGTGIQELLEQLLLIAEMQELSYQPDKMGQGVVLEARKEKGLGTIVSLLIQDGTLKTGQIVTAGETMGRIRQMKNDQGQIIKTASAGFPVEIIGFQDIPMAGELFYAAPNEKLAKELLSLRQEKKKELSEEKKTLNPEDILLKMSEENKDKKELNLILKTDVQGSLEALKHSLEQIKSEEVSLKIIHSGTGSVTESDILLANTTSGIVIGFNVRPDRKTIKVAKEKSVKIYTYSIIYELLDQVKKLLLGLLKAEFEEEEQGQAEVREVFHISKVGTVAGCYVISGQLTKNSFVRLVRDGQLIHEGKLSSLKRFKEDVKKIGTGFECGLSLEKFNDIKPKDILESYIKKEKLRTEL